MVRVLLVAFEGVQTLDATGPAEVFSAACVRAGAPHYTVELLSTGGGLRTTSSSLCVKTGDLLRVRPRPSDIVVVAGGGEEAIVGAIKDAALTSWLRKAAPIVRRLTSVCSGSFVLAAAGLLDGRRVATHWSACSRLARMFPALTVDHNAIFVADGSVWTSAGVTTGIDMALALVEEELGSRIADAVASDLVLYTRRLGYQSQFSDALVAQRSGSDPLGPAIAWARANLRSADIEGLARRAGLSVRTLHRRCLDQLGTTPAKLIEKLRVEQARSLSTTSKLPAKSVAAKCGFGSAAHMKRAFQRELGLGPREYRMLHAKTQRRTPNKPSTALRTS